MESSCEGARVLRRSMVKPKRWGGEREVLYLSSLDLFWRDIYYNLRVVFYEGDLEEGGMEKLRQSLGEVLVHFYPAAGRLVEIKQDSDKEKERSHDEECARVRVRVNGGLFSPAEDPETVDGPTRELVQGVNVEGPSSELAQVVDGPTREQPPQSRYFIDCNDEGVEWVEAELRGHGSVSDMKLHHFDFRSFFPSLAQLGHLQRSDHSHLPLVSIQVTRFHEGGFAIAINHNHVLMDGFSLWHFMVSWSEIARGLPLTRPPVHTRSLLKPKTVSCEIAKLIPFQMVPFDISTIPKDLVDKVFYFSAEVMERLRDKGLKAMNEEGGPKRAMSSLEVFLAHCWRHITLARNLPNDAKLNFIVLADWRRPRPNNPLPPVPPTYFGNAITWTATYATPQVLLNESFASTLARIVNVVDECSHPNTLDGMIHWLELHDTRFHLGAFWFPGVTMNVASSPRFPVQLVDFGWGPPSCARPIRVGGVGGELCLFPDLNGGINLCTKLDSESMQRLLDDPLFLRPNI